MQNINKLVMFLTLVGSIGLEAQVFSQKELLGKVADVIEECRSKITEIDNQPAGLWKPNLGFFDFSNKKELDEVNKFMSYPTYISVINEMKIHKNRTKGTLDDKINGWKDLSESGLKKLNVDVSSDLRSFGAFCGPIYQKIKGAINRLTKIYKK